MDTENSSVHFLPRIKVLSYGPTPELHQIKHQSPVRLFSLKPKIIAKSSLYFRGNWGMLGVIPPGLAPSPGIVQVSKNDFDSLRRSLQRFSWNGEKECLLSLDFKAGSPWKDQSISCSLSLTDRSEVLKDALYRLFEEGGISHKHFPTLPNFAQGFFPSFPFPWRRLIGLGLGSTPAGDDFILGLLAVKTLLIDPLSPGHTTLDSFQSYFSDPRKKGGDHFTQWEQLEQLLRNKMELEGLTTELSAHFLNLAIRGYFDPLLVQLFSGASRQITIRQILSRGHNSGEMTLRGILFALEWVIKNNNAKPKAYLGSASTLPLFPEEKKQ